MSQEMNFEFEQNVLLEERIGKYDLLKGLKSSGEYGYENFSQFYDSFSAGVVHKNYDILCVVLFVSGCWNQYFHSKCFSISVIF